MNPKIEFRLQKVVDEAGVFLGYDLICTTTDALAYRALEPETFGIASDGNLTLRLRAYANDHASVPSETLRYEYCVRLGIDHLLSCADCILLALVDEADNELTEICKVDGGGGTTMTTIRTNNQTRPFGEEAA